ncbi:type II toxin-antitoxin system Phd/YefM family antitoxin [Amycolatopsis jiangsuensis]|uniref:Prevent-host-death family protein n=1 Tax=Amycolatopsis jiangsuensis TaxID=1181879 RepID=A0A840IS79_9PSEU|nr:type II toxin-antitoxin system prevent-host-death family antitoxin [Amycolatopsis jiangsuensis]MBB4684750.1 prevent-host-death family protein [Amycolatopsis jiangsuensis]
MGHTIGQRELRNDNADVMRRVAAGESFTVTRNGTPVADLVPHQPPPAPPRRTAAEVQAIFRRLPPMDSAAWRREREAEDEIFGPDDLGEPGGRR